VILADTTAWVEVLRGTGSTLDLALTRLLDSGAPVAVTEPVLMELLAARLPVPRVRELRRRLLRFRMLRVGGLETFELSAAIYRACRARGETVRSMLDCLIAAVAIREGASLLHADRDFDVIARHTPLLVHPVDA
jgi:hypothetical protein